MEKKRRADFTYALEVVPRPGAREICVRRPPDGQMVRSRRNDHGPAEE